MNHYASLCSILLDENSYPSTVFDTTQELYKLYSEKTGITIEDHSEESTPVENGHAVSAGVAAFCLIDLNRTQKFSRGLKMAIEDLTSTISNRKVRVLYAGSGPYATLMAIIAPFLDESKVEFSLMDVHQHALDSAENLIEKLGFSGLVKEYILEDASKYTIDPTNKPDIIVSETMMAALYKEPQVSITLNLLSQSNPEVVFIPENIRLDLGGFVVDNKEVPADGVVIKEAENQGCIFNLAESLSNYLSTNSETIEHPSTLIGKEVNIEKQFDYYKLITYIDIYKDQQLEPNESSLTIYRDIKEVFKAGSKIKGQYTFSDIPELKFDQN